MMMSMPMNAVQQPAFVPIPLTGDEEDNEDPTAPKTNVLPMYGNSSNYNINNLLYNNIMENEYFRALFQLRTYHEVIDEIYRSADHVEPWQTGTARFPSSAFCLLVKFMLMKLTVKQMKGLLATKDCANVRAIGLLYLRYTCPPTDLWKWYEPYLEDSEQFSPGADKTAKMTIGEYCVKLLTDMQYYGTTLPRIPVPIERKMKVMLLLVEEKKKRRRANLRDQERGLYAPGAKVRAIYSDDANEPAWYEAVIDSVDADADAETEQHKYWVTFPEYGNTECVDLGDMELLGQGQGQGQAADSGDANGDAERGGRNKANSVSRSRSRSRDVRDNRGKDYDNRDRDSRDRGGGYSRDNRDRRDRDDSRDRGRNKRSRDDSRDRGGGGGGGRDRDKNRARRDDSSSRDRSHDRGGNRGEKTTGRSSGSGSSALSGAGGSSSDLLQKVLQSEREASAAVGRHYGQRPASYKGSMALKVDRYTVRRKSPSPVRGGGGGGGGGGGSSKRRSRSRSNSPNRNDRNGSSNGINRSSGSSNNLNTGAGGVGGGADRRLQNLKDRYGDASATTK